MGKGGSQGPPFYFMSKEKKKLLILATAVGVVFLFLLISEANNNYWEYKAAELEVLKMKGTEPMVFLDSLSKYNGYQVKFDEMKVSKPDTVKVESKKPVKLILEYEQNFNGKKDLVRFEGINPSAEERVMMYSAFDMQVEKIRNEARHQPNFNLTIKE